MFTLTEFCTFFRQDNHEMIKEAIEECGLLTVIKAVEAYSAKQGQISSQMTRVILESTLEMAELYHVIWSTDQIINGDNNLLPEDPILDLISVLALMEGEPDEEEDDFEILSRRLIEIIGLCPESEFKPILSFMAKTDMILVMPESVILAMLERIKRLLGDDRYFFSTLYSAVAIYVLEETISEIEELPEMDLALGLASIVEVSTEEPYEPVAVSGPDWFAQSYTRKRDRRREF